MTSGEQYTFWELIKRHKIVVPKIQRDYVQGRENKTIEKNREEFVKELIGSLAENKPMSLNFVYGTIQNGNEFIPIDGQQRLTTLFLLHLYVLAKKGDIDAIGKLQKQFSYQTRYTTNRFFEELAKDLPNLSKSDDFAQAIRASGWYVTPWDNDPNILSCIVMLGLIHENYKQTINGNDEKSKQIAELLIADNCPITFMWLQLPSSFGSDNQLYIRMNSRGKQLTDFENFKAELYEKVLKSEKGDNDKTNNFKKNIDGEWYSMLWDANVAESNVKDDKKIDIEKEALLIDSLLKRLIHWMIVSKACVERSIILKKERGGNKKELAKDEDAVKQKEEHDNLYQYCMPDGNEKIDVLRCGVEEYQSLVGKDGIKTCITEDLNSLLTFWVQLKADTIFKYIVQDILAVSDNKGKNIYNIDSYSPRVLLYAITKFAKVYGEEIDESGTINDFKSWYRVILNLVSTQEIDSPEAFQKAVRAIEEWNDNTADWLKSEKVKGAFRSAQVKEEILKLNLVKQCAWESAIREAENTNFDGNYQARDYFRGQIAFLLYMANSPNSPDGYDLEKFKYYTQAVKSIFDKETYLRDSKTADPDKLDSSIDNLTSLLGAKNEENSFDNLFHRAMLIYGNYWVNAPGNNIKTFFVYNESHNNYDWRGAFRESINRAGESCNSTWNIAVTCLKELLNGFEPYYKRDVFEFDQFRKWLTNEVENFKIGNLEMSDEKEKALCELLIGNPNCFKYIRNNYYVYWGGKDQPPKYLLMQLKRQRAGSIINITNELTQGQTP